MTAVDKTNDQRTLIPIMGIGQALVHHCSCIAAYVGDLPLYILLLDIIFALDIRVSHLQFFFISLLFQAGIYARHTKEQE